MGYQEFGEFEEEALAVEVAETVAAALGEGDELDDVETEALMVALDDRATDTVGDALEEPLTDALGEPLEDPVDEPLVDVVPLNELLRDGIDDKVGEPD